MRTLDQIYMDVGSVTNIGFDLHGVLDTYPDELLPLLERLYNNGYVIHILSGPDKVVVEQHLEKLGYVPEIHYHYVFSIVDYLKAENAEMWQDEQGRWFASPEIWWKSKGDYCKIAHCDFLIDNSIEYKEYVPRFTDFRYITNKSDCETVVELLSNIIDENNSDQKEENNGS